VPWWGEGVSSQSQNRGTKSRGGRGESGVFAGDGNEGTSVTLTGIEMVSG